MSLLSSRFGLLTNLILFRAIGTNCILSYKSSSMSQLIATNFEVFGKVQGVFFRKFTKDQADKLGINGWCMNTSHGTVVGYIEGPEEKVNEMTHWLKTTGSPTCKIDRTEIKEIKNITSFEYSSFSIKK